MTTVLKFLLTAVGAVYTVLYLGLTAHADEGRWAELKPAFFADREIQTSENYIVLETPGRAMDAAVVPVVIRTTNQYRSQVKDAGATATETHLIKKIHLIVDQNPLPLAAVFSFSDAVGLWDSLETNIRINEYTDVRAIAELSNGSLHMVSKFVKASGGCSAPAMADLEIALAGVGQLDILLGEISGNNSEPSASTSTEALLSISHPNNSGMQFDQVSRNYIPAFYVSEIGLQAEDELLLEVATNFSLSENPVVKLVFSNRSKYSNLQLYAVDSKGHRYEKSLSLDDGQALLDAGKTAIAQ